MRSDRQVDPECPLSFNPAAGVRRPQSHPFDGASLLSRAEMERLLGYMQRDSSPLGRREYAFTLARLRLGVALHSLQKLRWGQIHCDRKGEAWVRWREEAEPVRLPEQAWEAIQQWLTASGRRADIREGDYIFTPLVDPLQREASDRGEAWARKRHLSVDAIEDNLRLYGLRVGIDKRKLTPLALRRTALRLRLDSGDGPEQMRAFMDGQGRVRNTRRLMGRLPRLPPDPAPESQGEPALPLRKSMPYPPGAGLKHGLFAQSQPIGQVLEVLAEDVHGVEAELTGLRLLSRGLMALQAQARNGRELSQLAQAYSLTAQRLATMITAEKQLAARQPAERMGGKFAGSAGQLCGRKRRAAGKPGHPGRGLQRRPRPGGRLPAAGRGDRLHAAGAAQNAGPGQRGRAAAPGWAVYPPGRCLQRELQPADAALADEPGQPGTAGGLPQADAR